MSEEELEQTQEQEETAPEQEEATSYAQMKEGLEVESEAEATPEPEAPEAPPPPPPLPPLKADGYSVYVDGKPVEDLRGLTVEDLISGKAQLGYKALGQEHRRALNEVVRNASLGHLNATRQRQLEQDLQALRQTFESSTGELQSLRQQATTWDAALQRAAMGDTEPMQQIIEQYAEELKNAAIAPQQDNEELENLRAEVTGMRVLEREVRPYLQTVANTYGLSAQYGELERYALERISQIPAPLQTPERIGQYLAQGLLVELEAAGYQRREAAPQQQQQQQPPAPQQQYVEPTHPSAQQPRDDQGRFAPVDARIKALQAQIAALRGEVGAAKVDKAPPQANAPTGATEASGEAFTKDGEFDVKSYKEWLRSRG